MDENSKLYPGKIKVQCHSARIRLEYDITSFKEVREEIDQFVNDTYIKSESFDKLKLQCSNYLDVLDKMISINQSDIADYMLLEKAMDDITENLIGKIIIANKKRFMTLRDKAYEMERFYCAKAMCSWLLSTLAAYYYGMAQLYKVLGDYYNDMYLKYIAKEELYDRIEVETLDLFSNSQSERDALYEFFGEMLNLCFIANYTNCKYAYIHDNRTKRTTELKNESVFALEGKDIFIKWIESQDDYVDKDKQLIIDAMSKKPEKFVELGRISRAAGLEPSYVAARGMAKSICKNNREIISNPNQKQFVGRTNWFKYYENNVNNLVNVDKIEYARFSEELADFSRVYNDNFERYYMLEKKTGVPSELIAAIHYRENSKDYLEEAFDINFRNGSPLNASDPQGGVIFESFDESAEFWLKEIESDLSIEFDENTDMATMLTYAEKYNGFGYANNQRINPYLYSGTDLYSSGKYVKDGKYDSSVVDAQPGIYVLMTSLGAE